MIKRDILFYATIATAIGAIATAVYRRNVFNKNKDSKKGIIIDAYKSEIKKSPLKKNSNQGGHGDNKVIKEEHHEVVQIPCEANHSTITAKELNVSEYTEYDSEDSGTLYMLGPRAAADKLYHKINNASSINSSYLTDISNDTINISSRSLNVNDNLSNTTVVTPDTCDNYLDEDSVKRALFACMDNTLDVGTAGIINTILTGRRGYDSAIINMTIVSLANNALNQKTQDLMRTSGILEQLCDMLIVTKEHNVSCLYAINNILLSKNNLELYNWRALIIYIREAINEYVQSDWPSVGHAYDTTRVGLLILTNLTLSNRFTDDLQPFFDVDYILLRDSPHQSIREQSVKVGKNIINGSKAS